MRGPATAERAPQSGGPALRRALSTPLVVLYGLGVTVGAGIYVLVGATAALAGPFAPVSFLIAAFVVGFTAMSYAELASRYPVSAGEAAYVEAGFNSDRIATLVGLMVALSGMVSAAAVSVGAAGYLQALLGADKGVLVGLVVVLMGIIAVWGIVQSVMIAAIITVIEIGGLLLVIAWSLLGADPLGVPVSAVVPPLWGPHWLGIGAASLLAFFAFVGFEDMANVAEEVKDPSRTMPLAIGITLVAATLLYIATTTCILLAVPVSDLAQSEAPLALVFSNADAGTRRAFNLIAIVATMNGVLIQIIMASRVLYGLASRGQLPRQLAWVSARTQTPVVATILVAAGVMTLALLFPIDVLASHTSQVVLLVFVLVNIALLLLKSRGFDERTHFRVPAIVPVLGIVTSVALFLTSFL
ncbi:MAG: APC family permease [Pseudomonadota bacterium]